MELSVSISLLVCIVPVIVWWLFWPSSSNNGPFPPGNGGLPLLGDTIAFVRALSKDSLNSFLSEKAAKFGPLFKISVFGGNVVVMDPPAGYKFFFTNENKLFRTYWGPPFARLLGPSSLALTHGEAHRICRRHLVNTFLSVENVWRFVKSCEESTLEHLDCHWNEGVEINTYKLMRRFTFGLICELCMSVKGKEEVDELLDAFEPWVAGLLQMPVNLPGFAYHRALNARKALHRLLEPFIVQRKQDLKDGKATPMQDLMSSLLTQPDEAGHMYTDAEIKDNIQFLLAAGYATSSSVLALTIRNIAKNPEVYKAIVEEHAKIAARKEDNEPLTVEHLRSMEYTWRVAQETMRMNPVVDVGMRITTKDFTYNGYNIPKGWMLLWSQSRCSEDARFFDNADKFDPTRFDKGTAAAPPYTYLPFGAGPRMCPGNEFAKVEILVFMHHLLKNYKWTLVCPDEQMVRRFVPMTEKGSLLKLTKCKVY